MSNIKRDLFIFLAALSCFTSCKNDVASTGSDVLQKDDTICVYIDTFSLSSSLLDGDAIYMTPDSFLLGEIDSKYGRLHADILTQLACPVDYAYPEGATLDSVCLFMNYTGNFGDGKAPLRLNVYEMDRGTFNYDDRYPSDLEISEYCSMDDSTLVSERDRILTAEGYTDSVYSSSRAAYIPVIQFRMSDRFAERFFAKRDFSSQKAYQQEFKGLYITSSFGGSTLLTVSDIYMGVYYTFTYQKAGKDTTVHDVKLFYANSEVRTINRYYYPNKEEDLEVLRQDMDEFNYVVSPAHIYTLISLPIKTMRERINLKANGKRPYVNLAKLRIMVDSTGVYEGSDDARTRDQWAQPAENMMIIKASAASDFFIKHELPSDTLAITAPFVESIDKSGASVYSYTYDISALLTASIRNEAMGDTLHMILVPVCISTTTSSVTSATTVTAVQYEQTLTATKIISAKNPKNPLTLEVVYSGF